MGSIIRASRVYTKEELCLLETIPDPCGVIIFGASGDLAFRKLFPSLFFLVTQKIMPQNFYVLGVARTKLSTEEFRKKVREAISSETDQELVNNFVEKCHYMAGDYDAGDTYNELGPLLKLLDEQHHVERRHLFYLSVPPLVYSAVVKRLGEAGLVSAGDPDNGWARVVIEKPFGYSWESANQLNEEIKKVLREKQIYRIDHYLGKETVQNILMFRFANILFEPVWNRNYIDNIQITASEKLGVEHRAGYYEETGILRDMFQNHLLQLLALVAMEPPSAQDADTVRDKRIEVFKCIRPFTEKEMEHYTVAGQYVAGFIEGRDVPGYRQEKNVAPKSTTLTFSAIRFELDNWRWQGVPFYVRAGKRLADRLVEVVIQFKRVPTSVFTPLFADQLMPNILKFRIQPDEGITIQFEAKHPGPKLCMSTVAMNFGYQATFKIPPPESYARLLHDAMTGDQTLFARSDEILQSWRIIDPIIEYWGSKSILDLPIYPAGSWGPKESDTLLAKTGRVWAL